MNYTVESHPPFEEQLLGSTLWPEVCTLVQPLLSSLAHCYYSQTEKLYGHGFELIAVCSAHSLPIIATACKATSAEHAVIRLYDSTTWKPISGQAPLAGHALTITSLRFSRDDRWLLSTSRDRTWRLFERVDGEWALCVCTRGERAERGISTDIYVPAASSKSHARIIWDGCWAADDSYFATASRDKTVRCALSSFGAVTDRTCCPGQDLGSPIWRFDRRQLGLLGHRQVRGSRYRCDCCDTARSRVRACSVLQHRPTLIPCALLRLHILAVGLENGEIRLLSASYADLSDWTPLLTLDAS